MHPKWDLRESEKKVFLGKGGWLNIQDLPIGEDIIVGRNFNSQVGTKYVDYVEVHRGFGFGQMNEMGEAILDLH